MNFYPQSLLHDPETGNCIGTLFVPGMGINTVPYTPEKLDRLGTVAAALIDALPHGSGIDGDWHVAVYQEKDDLDNVVYQVRLGNGYHAMDSMGGYAGWLDFTATIWLDDELDPVSELELGRDTLKFTLDFGEQDIAELQRLTDLEYGVSDDDTEFYGVDWQGVVDYLSDLLYGDLFEWLENRVKGCQNER